MRALFYYYLMDLYSNVPITVFGTIENPEQSSRSQVFNYIENELLAVAPDLAAPATVTTQYYGLDQQNGWLMRFYRKCT